MKAYTPEQLVDMCDIVLHDAMDVFANPASFIDLGRLEGQCCGAIFVVCDNDAYQLLSEIVLAWRNFAELQQQAKVAA